MLQIIPDDFKVYFHPDFDCNTYRNIRNILQNIPTYPLDLRFWSQLKKGDRKDVVSFFFCVYGPQTLLFQKHCYGNNFNLKQR